MMRPLLFRGRDCYSRDCFQSHISFRGRFFLLRSSDADYFGSDADVYVCIFIFYVYMYIYLCIDLEYR